MCKLPAPKTSAKGGTPAEVMGSSMEHSRRRGGTAVPARLPDPAPPSTTHSHMGGRGHGILRLSACRSGMCCCLSLKVGLALAACA